MPKAPDAAPIERYRSTEDPDNPGYTLRGMVVETFSGLRAREAEERRRFHAMIGGLFEERQRGR